MKYISTRDEKKNKIKKDFKYVTLKGLADDGGLYVPYKFPMFKQDKINNFKKMNYSQFSAEIISEFTGQDLNKDEIFKLSSKIYKKFSGKDVVSIKNFDKDKFLLELFHGPTFAFKDFALQLLGEIFDKFLIEEKKEMLILTATSGDTGSAAIEAFKNRKNIKIIILHPFEKVSEFQRRQMTTINSKNVFNIAINGNFDDCQKLVKSLFLDKKFNNDYNLGSVNSINWARILPQVVYYAYSAIKINNSNPNQLVNFVVPTGNFGDAYAGYVAKKVGFPIDKIIVATNSNDILSRFFSTGIYKRQRVKSTLSPSMDIQIASNFERLLNEIAYEDSIKVPEYMKQFSEKGFLSVDNKLLKKLLESFKSFSVSDENILKIIKQFHDKQNIIIDPHTAVGANALNIEEFSNTSLILLATAHPAKFKEAIDKALCLDYKIPKNLNLLFSLPEHFVLLENNISSLKNFIKKNLDNYE